MMHLDGMTYEDHGGRVSAVYFFMPSGQQAKSATPWKAIYNADDDGPSRALVAMGRDRQLGISAELHGLSTGVKAQDIAHLTSLGFTEAEAVAALHATGFKIEQAAEVLLGGGGPALLLGE